MSEVEGIGGVFLASEDPAALAEWYRRHLNVNFQEHPDGTSFFVVFRTRDVHTGQIRENPVFAITQREGVLAPPDRRGVTVNLRVGDLDKTLGRLAAEGVPVEDERMVWEGGRHAWIHDLDGNHIELYEELPLAPDSPYLSPTQ